MLSANNVNEYLLSANNVNEYLLSANNVNCRLHMLTEVEEGASFLFNYHLDDMKDSKEVADWLDKTVRMWQDRMEICQVV